MQWQLTFGDVQLSGDVTFWKWCSFLESWWLGAAAPKPLGFGGILTCSGVALVSLAFLRHEFVRGHEILASLAFNSCLLVAVAVQ